MISVTLEVVILLFFLPSQKIKKWNIHSQLKDNKSLYF